MYGRYVAYMYVYVNEVYIKILIISGKDDWDLYMCIHL